MHRRGVGAGAIAKKKLAEVRSFFLQRSEMSKQLETFKSNLEEFASKHKQEIRKNPEFRVQFQNMCATIGVDPLASGKGFWSEMLGVGDFYYELGVQIIEVCLALKHRNGGLIILDELHQQVLKGRGKFAQDVSHIHFLFTILHFLYSFSPLFTLLILLYLFHLNLNHYTYILCLSYFSCLLSFLINTKFLL
uniref:Vacuolar-sorting protein SNF8 n=1 Tax=Laticauda laticaudata TaxID=8630 RepID=A0A8C5S858_LATLA